jgi:hypothetical protein
VPNQAGWGSRFSKSGDSVEALCSDREPRRGRTFLIGPSEEEEDVGGSGEGKSFADLRRLSRCSEWDRGSPDVGGAP